MTTAIYSNGSKSYGQSPDQIPALLDALANHPLSRVQFQGRYIHALDNGATLFFGNFQTLSHVFRIETDEPEVIEALTKAIEANMQRPDFLSQPNPIRLNRIHRVYNRWGDYDFLSRIDEEGAPYWVGAAQFAQTFTDEGAERAMELIAKYRDHTCPDGIENVEIVPTT